MYYKVEIYKIGEEACSDILEKYYDDIGLCDIRRGEYYGRLGHALDIALDIIDNKYEYYNKEGGFDKDDIDCWDLDSFAERFGVSKRASKRIIELIDFAVLRGDIVRGIVNILCPDVSCGYETVGYSRRLIYDKNKIGSVKELETIYYAIRDDLICIHVDNNICEDVILPYGEIRDIITFLKYPSSRNFAFESLNDYLNINVLDSDNTCVYFEGKCIWGKVK